VRVRTPQCNASAIRRVGDNLLQQLRNTLEIVPSAVDRPLIARASLHCRAAFPTGPSRAAARTRDRRRRDRTARVKSTAESREGGSPACSRTCSGVQADLEGEPARLCTHVGGRRAARARLSLRAKFEGEFAGGAQTFRGHRHRVLRLVGEAARFVDTDNVGSWPGAGVMGRSAPRRLSGGKAAD